MSWHTTRQPYGGKSIYPWRHLEDIFVMLTWAKVSVIQDNSHLVTGKYVEDCNVLQCKWAVL